MSMIMHIQYKLTFQFVLDRFQVLTRIVGFPYGVEIRIVIGQVGILDFARTSFPRLCFCRW
jgi:hypothetical protein